MSHPIETPREGDTSDTILNIREIFKKFSIELRMKTKDEIKVKKSPVRSPQRSLSKLKTAKKPC
jgi:hypothetical protein